MTMPPLISDPMLVTTSDKTMFVCWVEVIGDGPRWVCVDFNRNRYNAGPYLGETTPGAIQARVSAWWEEKKALGYGGVTAEKLLGWFKDGR